MRKFLVLIVTLALPVMASATGDKSFNAEAAIKFIELYAVDTSSITVKVVATSIGSFEGDFDDITFKPLPPSMPSGTFQTMAKIFRGLSVVARGRVTFKISHFADVVVVTDNIKRFESLADVKLTVERKDITAIRESAVTDINSLEGFQARRNLRPGMILTTRAIERIPDVVSGRDVSIVYNDGLCSISAVGRALQSGMAGDYIKVKNKSSGKVVLARIIDNSVVAIDP